MQYHFFLFLSVEFISIVSRHFRSEIEKKYLNLSEKIHFAFNNINNNNNNKLFYPPFMYKIPLNKLEKRTNKTIIAMFLTILREMDASEA